MARVLVVDDDNLQSMSLGLSLTAKKHVVEMATNGPAAIRAGVSLRPDVLIVDWLLGQSLNGILVAKSVRAVNPATHSILLTGFPSQDVREAALGAKFFGFFAKPVCLEKLHAAIDKSGSTPQLPTQRELGYLEFDEKGSIVHTNDRARTLLGMSAKPTSSLQLVDVFSYRSLVAIDEAEAGWQSLSVTGDSSPAVMVDVKKRPFGMSSNHALLIAGTDEQELIDSETVKNLSIHLEEGAESRHTERRFDEHILLIDRDDLQRRLASMQLQNLGCVFHAAESHERALQIFEADPAVKVVLLDYGDDGEGIGDVVWKMRKKRNDTRFVGISTGFRKPDFAEVGVDKCLQKPIVAEVIEQMLQKATS
jgi:CheY-like chemotaxis protein